MNVKLQREHLNHDYGIKSDGLSNSTLNLFVNIPSHWEIKRLQFISQKVQTGTTPPTTNEEYYQNGTIDWFAPSDFIENQIYLKKAKKKLNEKSLQDGIVKCFPRGSILIIGIGATLGKVGLLDIAATSNQQINAILLNKDIEPKFVAYHLSVLQEIMKVISSATTIGILNQEKTKLIPLAIPPLNEQKLIADYLDRETTQIDNLIAAKEQMLTLLEEKREAIISRAVTRGLDPNVAFKRSGLDWLGDIPQHWEIKKLKFLIQNLEQGSSPQASNIPAEADELGILKLSAVYKGIFFRHENKALQQADENVIHAHSLRKGDVLITRGNTPQLVGDVCVVPRNEPNLLLPDLIYRLTIGESEISPEFLSLFLITPQARSQIQSDARGSSGSMVKISQGHILDWRIPVPPKYEQESIIDAIEYEQEKTRELKNALTDSIALLKERRAALITAAVTGQIDLEDMS